jgi:tetratricopeptide (TPR) repeat protein
MSSFVSGQTPAPHGSPAAWSPEDEARVRSFAARSVLEMGCGDGAFLRQIADHCDVHGCGAVAPEGFEALHFHPAAAFQCPPVAVDLALSAAYLEGLPADALPELLKNLDALAPMALHKVACHPGDLPTLERWVGLMKAANPAFELARLDCPDGDATRPVATFIKGHPAFAGQGVAPCLQGAEALLALGLPLAAQALVDRELARAAGENAFILQLALGNVLLAQERHNEAQAHFQAMVKTHPDRGIVYVNLCGAFLRAGQEPAARLWARIAQHAFPRDPEIARLAGLLHLQVEAPPVEAAAPASWMDKYDAWEGTFRQHAGCAFSTDTLRRIEACLPREVESSVETGCGKSTILFSNLARQHRVFALDDRDLAGRSSVTYFHDCPLSRPERVDWVFGPTQRTLPSFADHRPYDVILLDGPHGYPFPELEYLFLYPHLKEGGFLILDDVHIPTIGRLGDFIAEDEMFEFVTLVDATAVFRRTSAPTFDPCGDGWWTQHYNRRRVSPQGQFHLNDGPVQDFFSSQRLGERIH